MSDTRIDRLEALALQIETREELYDRYYTDHTYKTRCFGCHNLKFDDDGKPIHEETCLYDMAKHAMSIPREPVTPLRG